ncbi:uncharacterized protein K02A2.6-like [Diprion similis]|uniref:uncharacterized protein K02A2.6-like n=1 Tax=Diprion similis TaxID=362088 RepID=UPI001EF841E7|nr:uncharacterized protein K02A2.6-like [Diprion similis]
MASHREFETFSVQESGTAVAAKWKRWLRGFELYVSTKNTTNQIRKRDLLLHTAGFEVQDIYFSLNLDETDTENAYTRAVEKLTEYFEPTKNEPYERHVFRALAQKTDETTDQFIIRLRQQAENCGFGDMKDQMIRDQIIEKTQSSDLRRKLLKEGRDLTLQKTADIARVWETSYKQAVEMTETGSVNRISRFGNKTPDSARGRSDSKSQSTGPRCFRCGYTGHKGTDKNCPALDKECGKCGRKGHFKARCKTKEENLDEKKTRKNNIRQVDEENTKERESEDEYAFTIRTVQKKSGSEDNITLQVGGIPINFIIDSGSSCNIIDRGEWEILKKRGIRCKSYQTARTLYAYGSDSPLKLMGAFKAEIGTRNGSTIQTEIIVLDGKGEALLGKETAVQLGVLQIGTNINTIEEPDIPNFEEEFKKGFQGVGKLKDYQLEIPINKEIRPVAQPVRRMPYNLREAQESIINELLENDIIERVEGPTPWVSPVQLVPKKGKGWRMCVDMRRANEAIERERYPIPTVDEVLQDLNGSQYFSKLDIKWAYHQIELHEDSRQITTFCTSMGLFRYKRLMFGISCAPEMYHRILTQVLQGCEGVVSYFDDIVVHGKSKQEHDEKLRKTLQVLIDKGLTLNSSKYSSRTLQQKVNRCGSSQEKKLRSNGLRDKNKLLKKLKEIMVESTVLGFYDKDAETQVIADASPVGLGAVLIQKLKDGPRVIKYASKALTEVEKRYSQTEKEALALVWACEKFHMYLYGKEFELITDHKPLELIFGPKSKPCARIERWVLRLQCYKYQVRYKPGKSNIADPLSRLLDTTKQEPRESTADHITRGIIEAAVPKAMDYEEIRTETKLDDEPNELRTSLQTNKWGKFQRRYELIQNELGIVDDIIVRGTRIILPKSLTGKALQLAHEGHIGMVGMKQRLRTKVWWATVNKDVEQWCKSCHGCQLVGAPDPPEPMTRRKLPTRPWEVISMDFMGPLPSGHNILVVVDYYSRFFEIELMKTITADKLIEKLKIMFAHFGIPNTIISDNGRTFIDHRLKTFFAENVIHHHHTTPFWPQANGEVERQNRSILKRLKIAQATNRDWKEELITYLQAYRTTPHSVTGVAPAELMFNRKIRSKIPDITLMTTQNDDEEVRDRDLLKKDKGRRDADEKRHAKESEIKEGDIVLMQQPKENKLSTTYKPTPMKVTQKQGNSIIAETPEGVKYRRNNTQLKQYVTRPQEPKNESKEIITKEDTQQTGENEIPETVEASTFQDEPRRMTRTTKKPPRFDDYILN